MNAPLHRLGGALSTTDNGVEGSTRPRAEAEVQRFLGLLRTGKLFLVMGLGLKRYPAVLLQNRVAKPSSSARRPWYPRRPRPTPATRRGCRRPPRNRGACALRRVARTSVVT